MEDGLDFTSANAEEKAKSAGSLHLAALWWELAETYRELAGYHRRRNEAAPSATA